MTITWVSFIYFCPLSFSKKGTTKFKGYVYYRYLRSLVVEGSVTLPTYIYPSFLRALMIVLLLKLKELTVSNFTSQCRSLFPSRTQLDYVPSSWKTEFIKRFNLTIYSEVFINTLFRNIRVSWTHGRYLPSIKSSVTRFFLNLLLNSDFPESTMYPFLRIESSFCVFAHWKSLCNHCELVKTTKKLLV